MKKIALLIVIAALVYSYAEDQGISIPNLGSLSSGSDSTLETAYRNRQSNLQVQGQGKVIKILPDDRDGSRHQKLILKMSSGQTLLVAHNIDLAQRISGIRTGDTVEFYGEYEWSSKGGVIHWTHHDPNNVHTSGWLKHEGNTYQ
ncbi:MAG: DUF3465 domain-containing protein [Sedimenticola sp.]